MAPGLRAVKTAFKCEDGPLWVNEAMLTAVLLTLGIADIATLQSIDGGRVQPIFNRTGG